MQEKIKLGDDLASSSKKKKQDIPEEFIFINVRETLHAHKVVQYIEDSSSQHDNTDNDSDYYPCSQESFCQMGINRIESINKVEKRRKGKIETSREVKEFLIQKLKTKIG